MEHSDRAVSLHHGLGGWGVHHGVPGARLQCKGARAGVSAVAADGVFVSAVRAIAAAVSSRASGTLPGGDDDAAPDFADGNLRLRLCVVPNGGAAAGAVVRLPARLCAVVRKHAGLPRVAVWRKSVV